MIRFFRVFAAWGWFIIVYAEILVFTFTPWPESRPLWVRGFLAVLGAFLGGAVEATARMQP